VKVNKFAYRGVPSAQGPAVVLTYGLWQGEMVLREGERFTEDDVFFRIDGLFVEETGRLHAVVASSAPLMYPNLEASDFEKMTYPYR